jgi:hypothetical protein
VRSGDGKNSLLSLIDVIDFDDGRGHEYDFYLRIRVHDSPRFFMIFLFSATFCTSSEIAILFSHCIFLIDNLYINLLYHGLKALVVWFDYLSL